MTDTPESTTPESTTWRDRARVLTANVADRLLKPMTRGEGLALFFILVIISAVGLSEVSTTRKHEHAAARKELRAERRERATEQKESQTVKLACERSKAFGPPLIAFLEGAEKQLHIGALTAVAKVDGKHQPVIAYYRDTIPKSCPSK